MDQFFSLTFPSGDALTYILLGGAVLIGALLAAALVAALFLLPLTLFVPRRGKKLLVRDGVEQLERLGFTTVPR